MYLKLDPYVVLLSSLILCACPPKDDGGADSSSGAPGTDASESGDPTETGGPGATETGPATDTDDTTTTTTDTTTTGGPTSETAGSETLGEETATDGTGGVMPPADCLATDPAVNAAFSLALDAWPLDPEAIDITVACTVGAVAVVGDTVNTPLACELDGAPQATVLGIAASPDGPVAWAEGDAVQLRVLVDHDNLHGADTRHVQLRAADDALLMSGVDSSLDDAVHTRFLPLSVRLSASCAEGGDFFDSPMQVDFQPVDAPVVSIFHGHRGIIPISGEQQLAIDVGAALGSDLHLDEDLEILLRRVKIE